MTNLGANNYDTCDDIAMLQLKVTDTLEKYRTQWKAWDETKLLMMIMNQVAIELCRLEERKQVRRAQVIVDQKVREKRKREKE